MQGDIRVDFLGAGYWTLVSQGYWMKKAQDIGRRMLDF